MTAVAAVSLAPSRLGEAIVDARSPVHFLIGFAAGIFGIDPHLAALTFVGAKLVDEALRAGTKHAVFGRESGQSLGNELADLSLEIAGVYCGERLRERLAPEPAAGIGHFQFQPNMGFNYPNGIHP